MAKKTNNNNLLPDVTEVEVYALKGDKVYRVIMPLRDWKVFLKNGRVGNIARRDGWRYVCHQRGHGQYKGVVDLEYKNNKL